MKSLVNFFKQLSLGRVVGLVLAGLLLITSTACNASDVRNAKVDNLPVQVGGNNNPHKMGGDGYTNYKMSDPKVNSKSRADLGTSVLIASKKIGSNAGDLLYPGNNTNSTNDPAIGTVNPKALERDIQQFPKERQPVIDRSDPDAKILERVGENFKDAASFITNKTEEALDRPEMQPNPATDPRSH